GEGSSEHREVVAEDRDGLAFDRAQSADDAIAVGTVVLHPELVVVVAGEFVDLLEGIGIEESGDAFTGGLFAALVLIVHRALVAGVGSVPTLGEVLDALGCGPWGIRHASTITTRAPFIVHSHQKNLKWTGEQPTQSSSRRRRLRPPRCRGAAGRIHHPRHRLPELRARSPGADLDGPGQAVADLVDPPDAPGRVLAVGVDSAHRR